MLLAVALLAPLGSATAGVTPTGASALAGITTIHWTGNAKLMLKVPKKIHGFTEDRMRLFVSHGTYASVRIVSPLSPLCPLAGEPPHCSTIRLDYIADLVNRVNYPTTGPGHDHLTELPFDPSYLDAGLTRFFLFTDGQATLEVRPPGLSSRASHTARDKFRGRAGRLPIRCASGMCTPTSRDPLLFGGSTFDIGKSPGSVDLLVFSATHDVDLVPGVVPANQPHGLRQCIYPNFATAPKSSPNPADHPQGCDLVPTGTDDALDVATSTANETILAYPSVGVILSWRFADVTGPRYAGWHVASAGPAPTIRSAYAVWYSYTA